MDKIKTTEVSEAGYKYRNGKILFRRKKEEIDSSSQNEYNNEEIQSSRKFRFQHQNFPGEKESGSEAHRLAIWWATKENVVAGDQTLISMNDKWYLVEKFDDADNGYQVEDLISQKEYKEICEEISLYGRSGKIESIQRSTYEIDKLNQQRDSVGRKKSSIDSDETQHGREDNSLQRVGKGESQTRETSSNGRRNSEGGGQDRQIKSSRKEDNISLAISTRAKALPESKVRGNYVFSIKWRGELTKEKITSYIKGASWHNNDKTSFARALKEYGSVDEVYDNIYYHGTAGYIHNSLKPSIILPKDSYRGGGYGQEYYAICVSKSKNRASTFTGSEASGNVYTILLRNGAKVIEMPEIQDSVELEDYKIGRAHV